MCIRDRVDVVDGPHNDLRVTPNTYVESAIKNADFVFFLAFDVGGSRYLKKYQHTPQTQTHNMDGRNSFRNVSTLLTIVIMAFLLGLPAITISSDQKEHGSVGERKLQQQYAERLRMRNKRIQLKYGVTDYKQDPSSL